MRRNHRREVIMGGSRRANNIIWQISETDHEPCHLFDGSHQERSTYPVSKWNQFSPSCCLMFRTDSPLDSPGSSTTAEQTAAPSGTHHKWYILDHLASRGPYLGNTTSTCIVISNHRINKQTIFAGISGYFEVFPSSAIGARPANIIFTLLIP